MHRLLDCSLAELQAISEHPDAKGLELMVTSIIAHGIKKGDTGTLQWMLEYLIGAPHKVPSEKEKATQDSLTDDQIEGRIAALLGKDP